jgi:hypothetical protein
MNQISIPNSRYYHGRNGKYRGRSTSFKTAWRCQDCQAAWWEKQKVFFKRVAIGLGGFAVLIAIAILSGH